MTAISVYVRAGLRCRGGCGFRLVPQNTPDPVPDGFRRNHGRDLCREDYDHHDRAGTLSRFPRRSRTVDDVLDEWDTLRRARRTRREAAAAMGITVAALDKAIERGVQAGDRRAVWAPKSRHWLALEAADRAVAQGKKGWPRVLHV